MTRLEITEAMREAARKVLQNPNLKMNRPDRDRLAAIADGTRKRIDALWWDRIHKVVDQVKLDKLQRLADPARNPMEHERAVAGRKLDELKARKPPGSRPEPRPLPDRIEDWVRHVKTGRKPRRGTPQTPAGRSLPDR